MKKNSIVEEQREKQCGSCESFFYKGSECPFCYSGNWVFGCIDDDDDVKEIKNSLFSDWVESFYPRYYQCNEISRWQDLDKALSGEMEEDEAKEKNIPTCTIKIFHEYRELSETIFWKAVENFHATVCETAQIDVCRSMAGLKLNIQ